MKMVTFGMVLLVSSLCEAKTSHAILFGISVSVAFIFAEVFYRLIRLHSTLKTQVISRLIISFCMAVCISRLLGASFSGEVHELFYVASGVAGAAVSTLNCKSDGESFFYVIGLSLSIICGVFVVGIIREFFGYGTVFGLESEFVSNFTIGSLKSYYGGLLVSAAVTAIAFLLKERVDRKDGV